MAGGLRTPPMPGRRREQVNPHHPPPQPWRKTEREIEREPAQPFLARTEQSRERERERGRGDEAGTRASVQGLGGFLTDALCLAS